MVHRSGFGTNITSKKKKTCSVDMNKQQDTSKQQLEFPLLKFTHYRPFFSKSVSKVVVNDEWVVNSLRIAFTLRLFLSLREKSNKQQDTSKQQLEFPLLKFTHYRPFFSKSVSKVVVNDEWVVNSLRIAFTLRLFLSLRSHEKNQFLWLWLNVPFPVLSRFSAIQAFAGR